MKRAICLLLAVLLTFGFSACKSAKKEKSAGVFTEEKTDADIIENVKERFLQVTKIPRPSHHEEQISAYLYEWATSHGFSAERDPVGNVIYDVPAMEGYEKLPLVVLQAHMDMVCVAAEGVDYDPLNDPIKPIVTDETITADGTSLGADDGIGLALSMCVAEGLIAHGPIRIIYTVDEEDGMEGIFALDGKYVADAHYLINLDAEQSDSVIVSTASGILLNYSAALGTEPVTGADKAYAVSIKGLLGGHSGIDIDKNRVNATVNLAELIYALRAAGIEFSVASINGGSASNAIPLLSTAVIAIRSEDADKLKAAAADWQADMNIRYRASDPDLFVQLEETAMPEKVMTADTLSDLLGFITHVPDGVNTMSPDVAGLVESSSNLGKFKADADGLDAVVYLRSSDQDAQEILADIQTDIAEKRGYTVTRSKSADPWKYDPDSKLLKLVSEIFYELNGEEIQVQYLHAGLECGTFAILNSDLDMISIGPDLNDVHSPKETCVLNGIPKSYRLLEKLLVSVD